MELLELKEYIQEKFEDQSARLEEIKGDLKSLNGQVRSHDRWLWLIRGVGTVVVVMLGLIGIKVRII